jgi:hypothetical protein
MSQGAVDVLAPDRDAVAARNPHHIGTVAVAFAQEAPVNAGVVFIEDGDVHDTKRCRKDPGESRPY